MLEILIACLCTCLVFVTPLLGIGITLFTEKWLGLFAYVIGGAVPILLVGGAYALYDVSLRVMPCTPADRLACGEPLPYAFAFLVSWLCVIILANVLAQAALYFYLYVRREAAGLQQAEWDASTTPQ